MSSKFSGIPKVQKPPAVCKAPPPVGPIPPPPFDEQFFQGYAQWSDAAGTDRIAITGPMCIEPTGTAYDWHGDVDEGVYGLDLDLSVNPATFHFDLTITLTLHGGSVGAYHRNNIEPRSVDPWDTGLVDFIGIGGPKIVQARIMS